MPANETIPSFFGVRLGQKVYGTGYGVQGNNLCALQFVPRVHTSGGQGAGGLSAEVSLSFLTPQGSVCSVPVAGARPRDERPGFRLDG